ncbi:hypothetical protein P5V15_013473 [Pogonomyrmex californicus]
MRVFCRNYKYIHTYMYTCIHIHTYIYIYIYIYIDNNYIPAVGGYMTDARSLHIHNMYNNFMMNAIFPAATTGASKWKQIPASESLAVDEIIDINRDRVNAGARAIF